MAAEQSVLLLKPTDRIERRGMMAALDKAHPLIWFDGDGRVVDGNANTQALLGYDLSALMGIDYRTLVGETEEPLFVTETRWARICDSQLTTEERHLTTSRGSEIWSSISYAVVRNHNETVRRVLAIAIDMTPWSWRADGDTQH
jgi:methyl-accepting chemotaxis protein